MMNFTQETFGEKIVNKFNCLRGGRPGRVSPLDLQQIGQWDAQSVPLEVIFRVMEEAFQRNPQIASIRYFTNAVADAMKRRAHAYAGANLTREQFAPPSAPVEPEPKHAESDSEIENSEIEKLASDIRRLTPPISSVAIGQTGLPIEEECRRALKLLRQAADCPPRFADGRCDLLTLHTKLEEIEDTLSIAAAASLSDKRREEIAKSVADSLARSGSAGYMSREAKAEHIIYRVRILALAEFGIQRLQIF